MDIADLSDWVTVSLKDGTIALSQNDQMYILDNYLESYSPTLDLKLVELYVVLLAFPLSQCLFTNGD